MEMQKGEGSWLLGGGQGTQVRNPGIILPTLGPLCSHVTFRISVAMCTEKPDRLPRAGKSTETECSSNCILGRICCSPAPVPVNTARERVSEDVLNQGDP